MLELRVNDLRLRGRGFTLYPAANESNVDGDLMDFLVSAIYIKQGLCAEKAEDVKKANPAILDTISVEDLNSSFPSKYCVEDLVANNLVTIAGNTLTLTQKSITILKRAAEIQNQLDDEGFYYCPCCNH